MNATEFLRVARRGDPRPIYAVFGDDAYQRREVLAAIVAAGSGGADDDELGLTRFNGESAGLADVLDEVRTLPFLVKRRVVVVEGADPFVTAHRKELEAYAESPSRAGVLVLSARSWPSSTKLAKLVEKTGMAVECKAPVERELPGMLARMAEEHYRAKLDPDAAELLVELVGPELGLLASEVGKLATYVGDDARIRRADVARMVGAGRVETIWKVVDAATQGRLAEALDDVDRLLASGEHPVALLAQMAGSLRKVHHAGELRRARVELREACRRAGLAFGGAEEKVGRQHAHLGPTRVGSIPDRLLRADLDLKGSSQLTPRTIIERFLVELGRPRRD